MKSAVSICVFLIALAVSVAGCATASNYSYKLYPGPTLAEDELAVVELGGGLDHTNIDGFSVHRADFGRVLLSPGRHSIAIYSSDGGSLRYSVILEKNHQYRLLTWWDVPFGRARPVIEGQTVWGWIEDSTSGLVVGEFDGKTDTN